MMWRYVLFFIFTTLVNALFWYYIILFSALYANSSIGVVYSALIALAFDYFGLSILLAIFISCFRSMLRTCPKSNSVIDYGFWVIRIFFQ